MAVVNAKTLLRGREFNPSVRQSYHQHGPVFHIHGETVNLKHSHVDEEGRGKVVDEIVRKRGVFNDERI